MSRYLLLVLLNLPVFIAGIVSSVIKHKTKVISKRKMLIRIGVWLGILVSLSLIYPTYSYLFTHSLTESEPLSLFDVVQISAIIHLLHANISLRYRLEKQEKRSEELHRAISIKLKDQL